MDRNKIVFILVMIPLFAFLVYHVFFHTNHNTVIGNKNVISEITKLDILSSQKKLTDSDIVNLENMVHHDEVAMDYVEEIKWLIDHNETNHTSHTLGFLYNYIESGKDVPCLPHELEHITLYLKYNDTENLNKTLSGINEKYDIWYKNAKQTYSYNSIYSSQVDKTGAEIKEIAKQISNGNKSSEILYKAKLISDVGLC